MSLPELVRSSVEREVRAFCDRRIRAEARDEVRLEYSVRGNTVTVIERRAPWRPGFGPEWSSVKIAQLRYDPATQRWALWWADRNGRWNAYWDVDPTADIDKLLGEIAEDPTAIFWG